MLYCFILRIGKGLYVFSVKSLPHRRADCLLHAKEIANVSFFLTEDQIDCTTEELDPLHGEVAV